MCSFLLWRLLVRSGRRSALPQPPSSATKSALLLPMSRRAYRDRFSKGRPAPIARTKYCAVPRALASVFLILRRRRPVLDGPHIDWAIGCVVFDGDVSCGAFSAWWLLSLQHRFGVAKSALLWPTRWAGHSRLFKGRPSHIHTQYCAPSPKFLIISCNHPSMVLWSRTLLLLSFH